MLVIADRLEWAHTTSSAELLYPGADIDGAVVELGEIAVAVWTGSNGIALHGPKLSAWIRRISSVSCSSRRLRADGGREWAARARHPPPEREAAHYAAEPPASHGVYGAREIHAALVGA
ncbi:hypothetical protein ACFYZ5_45775 [Streptomyces chartreusis]|uniref:hypothetical protein n=1 Tax=Streptomyces chartreusis TaxID=1969 RepID=UPI00367CBA2C